MLYLIGVGLSLGGISVGSLEICRNTPEVYFDGYTSYIDSAYLDYLSQASGKRIKMLDRNSMEEDVSAIIDKAKARDVAILVAGDPLVATTHKIIFIEAKKAGVKVTVRHAESVLPTIMGESGLDFYRFGQVCTVPSWSEDYKPVSFYETIQKNLANNLHTVLLFDYDAKAGSSIGLKEVFKALDEAENQYLGGIFVDESKIFVMHALASPKSRKFFITVKEAKALSLDAGPTAMIIPAKLSEVEIEVIESIY